MLNEKSQLRYLDLSYFKNEVFVGELLESCHYLEKLSLKYSTFSTAMMRNLNFHNLEVLDITGCEGLNMGSVRQIMMFEKLTEINFSWPPTGEGLSTAIIDYLVKNIPIQLKKISFNAQQSVLDEHIAKLVTRCKEIRELQLFGVSAITNNSLDHIMKDMRKLEKLDISFTQIDLTKILELWSMPELQTLNCHHVKTVGDIKRLKKILPHLIINQERLKIADRSETLKLEQGFWDVHAPAVQDLFAVIEQEQHGINLGDTY
jgi:F-box and leucine-rich repeat protein 1 (S-phase kinase-associated protein 2)